MYSLTIPESEILGIECKHIAYQEALDKSRDDLLLIKEVVHTKDKRTIPRIRTIENFKRPIFIAKPNKRNYQDKKEFEEVDNLTRLECTQARLSENIQRGLGRGVPNPNLQLREVCRSPYVYLADLTTPTMLKAAYRRKAPDLISRSQVAVLDIETDMIEGHGEPIMISVTMNERRVIAIDKSFAAKIPNLEATLHELYAKYLSEITIKDKKSPDGRRTIDMIGEYGGDIDIIVDDNLGLAFVQLMHRVHSWYPDFLAIWNMDFDLPRIIKMLDRYNIPLEDAFCDPIVPDRYRHTKYKQASAKRETNSKSIAQHPADLWHVLFNMAGFYVIDAMCAFKKIRVANGNEPDYKLDGVLGRHLGIGKLKFEECKEVEGRAKWHIAMQRDFPAEYCIYCLFDCISIEILDRVTNDLGTVIPILSGISEFSIFPSLPKRLVDNLTYFYLERRLIAGCVGADIKSYMDEDVIDISGWIVTLPAYMVEDNGLFCVAEAPNLRTMFRAQTADDDIEQAYPTGGLIMNISKKTTAIELNNIDGISESCRRRAGINLTGGRTNAIEICNELFNFPSIHTVLDALESDIEQGLL